MSSKKPLVHKWILSFTLSGIADQVGRTARIGFMTRADAKAAGSRAMRASVRRTPLRSRPGFVQARLRPVDRAGSAIEAEEHFLGGLLRARRREPESEQVSAHVIARFLERMRELLLKGHSRIDATARRTSNRLPPAASWPARGEDRLAQARRSNPVYSPARRLSAVVTH